MSGFSWPELERVVTDLRFWDIAGNEATRALYVLPADVDRARWIVEQAGAGRRVAVKASPLLPANTWLLVDEQALEAGWREFRQQILRGPLFSPGPWYPYRHL